MGNWKIESKINFLVAIFEGPVFKVTREIHLKQTNQLKSGAD
jgi:hypothetical protein